MGEGHGEKKEKIKVWARIRKTTASRGCVLLLCAMISDDSQFRLRGTLCLFLASHYPFQACVWRWRKWKGMEDRSSFNHRFLFPLPSLTLREYKLPKPTLLSPKLLPVSRRPAKLAGRHSCTTGEHNGLSMGGTANVRGMENRGRKKKGKRGRVEKLDERIELFC